MIIKRKNRGLLEYWWISEDLGLDGKNINPSIPKNILVSRGVIDSKTKRILLYTSLDDAISVQSLGDRKLEGIIYGVYKVYLRPDDGIVPDISQCPYRDILDGKEIWCYWPVRAEKVADIKIGSESEKRPLRYGNPSHKSAAVLKTYLGRYSWKEILPEWDKKGKTKKLI